MADRLILLATSPRLPAGLLSWPAWEALRAFPAYAGVAAALVDAVRAAGIAVTVLPDEPDRARAQAVLDGARAAGGAVWLAGPDGDPGLVRALGTAAARTGARAEVEVLVGSWDPPGARLLDVVRVMDRLRAPGGCPWDAEQTHESLMPYLLEETYEAYAALEDADPAALREELGDVLLQVAFHARIAEGAEAAEDRFSIDDLAGDLVDKLVRRHPHVFGDVRVAGAQDVHARWEVIKAAEKERRSAVAHVPLAQPALSLAAALRRKAARAGLPADLLPAGDDLGHRLFALVGEAVAAGADPEAALRAVARAYRDRLIAAEG